jgi:hypothetical protein
MEGATNLRIALAIAELVIGIGGAAWFWSRARGFSL